MNDRELADAVLISKIKERQEWIDERNHWMRLKELELENEI